MSIQLLTSKTAVGILGNRAICAGFTSGFGVSGATLGPGIEWMKGFSIHYNSEEPMHDKLLAFAVVNTTDGRFPTFAYGVLTWDLETLSLHSEMRDVEIEGDADVPAPFFAPDATDTPPPMWGRASYLIGASLGMIALSRIALVYPMGWNKNVALKVEDGSLYLIDSWSIDVTTPWIVTTVDCVPSVLPKYVFRMDLGGGTLKLVVLDTNRIIIHGTLGLLNIYGRLIWTREAVYDCPGTCYVAACIGARHICGITRDKVCWIFDVQQQVFCQVSAIPWPDVNVVDNFLDNRTHFCYDERRGHLLAHQPRTQIPGSDPPEYIGNKMILFAMIPVPASVTDPVALDTLRAQKRTFWYSKILGDHGELISSKRITATLNNPVHGRMLSSQSASNARAQSSFSYGGPDTNTDTGTSSITVTTDDTPGLPA